MSKRQKYLRNPRIGDAMIFVRYLMEVMRAYRDDPFYVPSKGDLRRFHQIEQTLDSAAHFAAELHQRMEGRIEGRAHPKDDNDT